MRRFAFQEPDRPALDAGRLILKIGFPALLPSLLFLIVNELAKKVSIVHWHNGRQWTEQKSYQGCHLQQDIAEEF